MPNYELVVLFDPYLEDEAYASLVDKTKELVQKHKGVVTNVDTWGRRRLAYPIDKKVEAYYVVVSFAGQFAESSLKDIVRALRLNERVLRVMLTRLPDLTKKMEKAKKSKEVGEASSSASNAGFTTA